MRGLIIFNCSEVVQYIRAAPTPKLKLSLPAPPRDPRTHTLAQRAPPRGWLLCLLTVRWERDAPILSAGTHRLSCSHRHTDMSVRD